MGCENMQDLLCSGVSVLELPAQTAVPGELQLPNSRKMLFSVYGLLVWYALGPDVLIYSHTFTGLTLL
jgi:hypothetical protein